MESSAERTCKLQIPALMLRDVLMPRLINAHTHLFQTFLRGLADDKPLLRWLKEEVYLFAGFIEEEDFTYPHNLAVLKI